MSTDTEQVKWDRSFATMIRGDESKVDFALTYAARRAYEKIVDGTGTAREKVDKLEAVRCICQSLQRALADGGRTAYEAEWERVKDNPAARPFIGAIHAPTRILQRREGPVRPVTPRRPSPK